VEGGKPFKLVSDYQPAGDQPTAIKELVDTALTGEKDQVLLGVTGSGKTHHGEGGGGVAAARARARAQQDITDCP